MLDSIKYLMTLNSVDKNIAECNFETAMNKLNMLIREDYKPSKTYIKRGKLCKKLFMYDDAYSDFTYVIAHCAEKSEAYFERVFLNYEISNYYEAITDANVILEQEPDNFEIKRIKFLSFVFAGQKDTAEKYLNEIFENKFEKMKFLFDETAKVISTDEYSKGLKLLEIVEMADRDNPIKLFKEASIYGFAGDKVKQNELLERLDNVFPKYFVSHFRFYDMYEQKDMAEIAFLLELAVFDKNDIFKYPLKILEGYKNHYEGHVIASKECFEEAIELNPSKPEGYVLLAQTYQLMAGYDNPEYTKLAEENYSKAEKIYEELKLPIKAQEMKRQLQHLNSPLMFR